MNPAGISWEKYKITVTATGGDPGSEVQAQAAFFLTVINPCTDNDGALVTEYAPVIPEE